MSDDRTHSRLSRPLASVGGASMPPAEIVEDGPAAPITTKELVASGGPTSRVDDAVARVFKILIGAIESAAPVVRGAMLTLVYAVYNEGLATGRRATGAIVPAWLDVLRAKLAAPRRGDAWPTVSSAEVLDVLRARGFSAIRRDVLDGCKQAGLVLSDAEE